MHLAWNKSIPTHRDFVDRIVIMLLTNRKDGAPELSPHQVELRKRQRQFRNDEGDDDDDSCAVDHQIMSIKIRLETGCSGAPVNRLTGG